MIKALQGLRLVFGLLLVLGLSGCDWSSDVCSSDLPIGMCLDT